MKNFLMLCLLVLSVSIPVYATPIVYQGSWQAPAEFEPGYTYSPDILVVPESFTGPSLLTIDVSVRPDGGTWRENVNQNYFNTFTSIALFILDKAGNLINQISLSGRAWGFDPKRFTLFQSVSLDVVPSTMELFLEGRDAMVKWSVCLFNEGVSQSVPMSVRQTVPEPATWGCLLLSGMFIFRKRPGYKRVS